MNDRLLPPTARYALRATACLANLEPGAWATAEALADQAHLPPAFARKVLRRLVASGLVEGRKGWHGGFRLTRPPSEVHFAEVLAAVGEEVDPEQCAFGLPRCDAAHPCPLHPAWSELRARFQAWAERHTLAEALPG